MMYDKVQRGRLNISPAFISFSTTLRVKGLNTFSRPPFSDVMWILSVSPLRYVALTRKAPMALRLRKEAFCQVTGRAGNTRMMPVWLCKSISCMAAAQAKLPSSVKGRYVRPEYPFFSWSPFRWKLLGEQKALAKMCSERAAASPSKTRACKLASQLYV